VLFRSNSAFRARRSVAATRLLHPGLLDFDAWLARHRGAIPVPAPLAASA
jgi:hypothetical protein